MPCYGSNTKNGHAKKKFAPVSNAEKIINSELTPKEILVKYGSLNAINKIICNNNSLEENQATGGGRDAATKKNASNGDDDDDDDPANNARRSGKSVNDTALLESIYKALKHEQRANDISNPLWFLSEQTIKENGQVLIFATDRASTESIALKMASSICSQRTSKTIFPPRILRR